MLKFYIFILAIISSYQIYAQKQDAQKQESKPENESIRVTIIDDQKVPVFGVYVSILKNAIFLTTSDMDGECIIKLRLLENKDTLNFNGLGFANKKITLGELIKNPIVHLENLEYDLGEVVIQELPVDKILQIAGDQFKKTKSRLPICRYYGPALYEKITQCRDTAVEYRKEYGLYFTSGDLTPYTNWDRSFRSYFVPKYIARTHNLETNGKDTIIPIFVTSEESRYDIGTRKIFTLARAVQLYGPLFCDLKNYNVRLIENDSLNHIFSFATRPEAYPKKVRISCKGTFSISRSNKHLNKIDFDYIDYHLLRQILLSNSNKIESPFSTKASLTFAEDSIGYYLSSCHQTTSWKYDLGENFVLIEQPSRDFPGLKQLVEEEAFYCFYQQVVPQKLQNKKILSRIHFAHRYPTGSYDPEILMQLPKLLDISKAQSDLGRHIPLEYQFNRNNDKPYYPDNYLQDSDIDKKERINYSKNLTENRERLFELFNIPTSLPQQSQIYLHPNK